MPFDHCEIRSSQDPKKGIEVAAKKWMDVGDTIASEKAFSSIIASQYIKEYCSNCWISKANLGLSELKSCGACKWVSYCSKECQKKDWKQGLHSKKCPLIKSLLESRPNTKDLVAGLPQVDVTLLLIGLFIGKDQNEEGWKEIISLVSHREDVTDERKTIWLPVVMKVATLLGLQDSAQDKELILNLICIHACNTHSICDEEITAIGSGLYPKSSRINHSCHPNATPIWNKDVMELRAIRKIAPGEPITMNYVEIGTDTIASRSKTLKSHYYFSCDCSRCTSPDWLILDQVLTSYKCKGASKTSHLTTNHPFHAQTKSKELSFLQPLSSLDETCGICGSSWSSAASVIKVEISNAEALSDEGIALRDSGTKEKMLAARSKLESAYTCLVKYLHPFHRRLISIRNQLLYLCFDLQDWSSALQWAHASERSYQVLYPELWPIVGLQAFRTAKLAWLLALSEEALSKYQSAAIILVVTHGRSHPLTKDLFSRLAEAESEVQWMKSQPSGAGIQVISNSSNSSSGNNKDTSTSASASITL